MKKFSFSCLIIELTRRCNMNPICAHCMRGNPQDLTISKETIDTMLKKTLSIGRLLVTGGEPTLCLDELEFIIDKLWEYKIPIFGFEMTINGLIYDERLIGIIKKYSELITLCRKIDFPDDKLPAFMEANIQISQDQYHSHSKIAMQNFEKYREALRRIAQVTITNNGTLTRKVGNAKKNNLVAYYPFYDSPNTLNNYQICFFDKDHHKGCQSYPHFKLTYDYQVMIACSLELKCDGNIIRDDIGDLDYKTMDDPCYKICNVNDDLYEALLKYNAIRMPCEKHQEEYEVEKYKNIFSNSANYQVAEYLYNKKENERTLDTYVFQN